MTHKYTLRNAAGDVIDGQEDVVGSTLTLQADENGNLIYKTATLALTVVTVSVYYGTQDGDFDLTCGEDLLLPVDPRPAVGTVTHTTTDAGGSRGAGLKWSRAKGLLVFTCTGPELAGGNNAWTFGSATPTVKLTIKVKRQD